MAERESWHRWLFVGIAAVAMGIAGTYQFAWSSIRVALGARIAAPEAALGTVLTVFVIFQTTSQFPAGWVRDRYGPKVPLLVATPLAGLGYAGAALATRPIDAYVAYAVGGIGAGIAYTVAINTPVKWFDERRGLATGIVSMTYGGISFLLIPVLRRGVETEFRTALLGLAVLAGVGIVIGVPILRDPSDGSTDGTDGIGSETMSSDRAYTWREAIRTWQFWLLYGVFIIVNGVGLMLIGKVVAYASALGLADSAGTASASLIALGDAAGLVVIGHLSDRFGRERTVVVSLMIAGLATGGTVLVGQYGLEIGFVIATAVAAFFRSPAFVILPSLVGEYYGTTYSSENYAVLYSAKLWGGVIGGTVASSLIATLGWLIAFGIGGLLLTAAGGCAILLRPVEE
ncbi:MAG: OFA family MFS transporter [Halobacteriales archaeon]